MLNLIDEFTHECLAIQVRDRLRSTDVIDVLSDSSSCVVTRTHPFRQRPKLGSKRRFWASRSRCAG